ncbi:MAG: patatin-like phospholipase family protein [Bacteroidales bacterium]
MKSIRIVFLFFLVFPLIQGHAQKVGLVLSGGGAKGIAHIGVIKALEDNHIPIDYITGTSMGAIVGGLYAAGYSPDEMDSIIQTDDFLNWAEGKIEEQYRYYYTRDEQNSSWVTLKVSLDSMERKPLLPSSIIEPFQMDFAFMQIFTQASTTANNNFDSLFVPFRCMASDIQNNKPVILKQGNLGRAIRASMSYPFYFKPITIDGVVMLDGGMYNNFPADVMLDVFNPDIIIGSKVAGNYSKVDPSDIFSQMQTIMMEQTDYNVFCESSVLIEPNTPAIGVTDFSLRGPLVDSGYVATQRKIDEIRLFLTDSLSPMELQQKRKSFKRKSPPLIFNKINVKGLNQSESAYLKGMLLHYQDTVGIDNIKEDYFRVLADQHIAYIYPEANYNHQSGYYQLDLEVEKDKNMEVQFGGTVSSSPINEAFLQLKYKHLNRVASSVRLNSHIGRFYSSVSAIGRLDFAEKTPFFLKAGTSYNQWDYFKTSTMFFEDKTPSYLIKNDFQNFVSVGSPITNNSKIEAGFNFGSLVNKYYQSNQFSRQDTADKTTFQNYYTNLKWELNTLNRKQFASEGRFFKIELKNFHGQEVYDPGTTSQKTTEVVFHPQWIQLSMEYLKFFPVNKWFTFGVRGDIFTSNRELNINQVSSLLMAKNYTPVPETKTVFLQNFIANNYVAAGIKNIVHLEKNFNLHAEGYLFQPTREILSDQNDNVKYGPLFHHRYFLGSMRAVYNSPIGPISLYLNYYQGHEDPFAFGLNIGYILYNEHSLN